MALIKCKECGKEISDSSKTCIHCGAKIIKDITCIECNNIYPATENCCPKCGKKTAIKDLGLENTLKLYTVNAKKTLEDKNNKKKLIYIISAIVLTILLCIFIPKLFVSYTSYLEKGDFAKAYSKAKDADKEKVLIENILTVISADVEDGLNNPDSFKLKEAYYDDESFVLVVNGTNKFGAVVTNYWYYTFDDDENMYTLFAYVTNFDKEETYSWDSYSEKIEKIFNNLAKSIIKSIISEPSYEVDSNMVKRINKLHESGILQDVKLITEVTTIYPYDNTNNA